MSLRPLFLGTRKRRRRESKQLARGQPTSRGQASAAHWPTLPYQSFRAWDTSELHWRVLKSIVFIVLKVHLFSRLKFQDEVRKMQDTQTSWTLEQPVCNPLRLGRLHLPVGGGVTPALATAVAQPLPPESAALCGGET